MNKNRFFIYCTTFTAFVVAGFFAGVDPAFAQEANEDQTREVIEEVVKIEAQIERRFVGPTNALGARTEIFELKRQVSFAGLDLSQDADVIELKSRIEDTAKELCEELAEMRPIPPWDKTDFRHCITGAIESANDDLDTMAAAL